ncbi:abdominal ganglion neuropeptides L5-67 precursor [Aplysia californica]|uniref:Abdominal ganglion neuropeptides L5-67 n=1 Tax=Aplysia californica TaxID=6500 RepID=AGN5_APLCA|nr:abdominal ganglion neuropeptides L5-67 precursor [Aplysia californica]P07712.1 RecName: Full=Abdominal ganglion neuropeptides L5-67; Contains: RecName: Full=Luqin; Contains: RecName: Full=Luqin-B; Contains: RecName: Full=Luqin-C; Contains: RecName: Full=Proline-rich mature peptide; Short=PRMP; Flags: Precursor [Aplysia californica]AAA27764.1 neuropeptide precursor [Aplysia californica]prf//2108385A luqin [Aplysia californica]
MKTAVLLVCLAYVMAAILSLCASAPSWRPQGRFGKRTIPDRLPQTEESSLPDFGFSHLPALPLELFYNPRDLVHSGFRPRLCSVSGVEGYPPCVESHSDRKMKNLLDDLFGL